MKATIDPLVRQIIQRGIAIPATPLALNAQRKLDERRQRALYRYYIAAGSGGVAVGVHTTQFAIRDPKVALYRPVLEIGSEEIRRANENRSEPVIGIAGVCGITKQAAAEAKMANDLGYNAVLLSLAAMKDADEDAMIAHCIAIAEIIPVVGFYLQPAVGGRVLPYRFWRRFCEIDNVVAIKIAPFNRYQTIDVIRAVVESERDDIALYTGNDDNIVMDLLTPYRFYSNGQYKERRVVGGLLGHWSVWTQKAVSLLSECHKLVEQGDQIPGVMLKKSIEVTDTNAAFFDSANAFTGCIAGLHEVLKRQGLLKGIWCLNPNEGLSEGQAAEIDRVYQAYPHLNDDQFVSEHLNEWLSG